eukprot:UN07357
MTSSQVLCDETDKLMLQDEEKTQLEEQIDHFPNPRIHDNLQNVPRCSKWKNKLIMCFVVLLLLYFFIAITFLLSIVPSLRQRLDDIESGNNEILSIVPSLRQRLDDIESGNNEILSIVPSLRQRLDDIESGNNEILSIVPSLRQRLDDIESGNNEIPTYAFLGRFNSSLSPSSFDIPSDIPEECKKIFIHLWTSPSYWHNITISVTANNNKIYNYYHQGAYSVTMWMPLPSNRKVVITGFSKIPCCISISIVQC